MRVAAVIVILWCLFSVYSCGSGSKTGARFQEIDRLTDSLPREAIRCLDSINTAGLSEKDLNRYRLLWIKSRDLTEWTISDKERNVALLMRCGFSNSQIATLLAKSKSTISSQRNAIEKKAGLTVNGINAAIASL